MSSTPVDQPNATPTQKIASATLAGALTVVSVWVAGKFGVVVPGEVGGSLTVVFAAIAGYFTRERVPYESRHDDEE